MQKFKWLLFLVITLAATSTRSAPVGGVGAPNGSCYINTAFAKVKFEEEGTDSYVRAGGIGLTNNGNVAGHGWAIIYRFYYFKNAVPSPATFIQCDTLFDYVPASENPVPVGVTVDDILGTIDDGDDGPEPPAYYGMVIVTAQGSNGGMNPCGPEEELGRLY